ncbi:MAG: secretion protein [Synergistaceae bacterium]|nr:secretion protein [Synergistaceae bacterium]
MFSAFGNVEAAYEKRSYSNYQGGGYSPREEYRDPSRGYNYNGYNYNYGGYRGDYYYQEDPRYNFSTTNGKPLSEYLPTFFSFEFYQIGDSDLVLSIKGRSLPGPEVSYFDNKTMIVFREVFGERTETEHRSTTSPMITEVRSEQIERDFVITITTERPLQLQGVRGAPPSDSYTLRLTTVTQIQKKIEEPNATLRPQTPAGPTGPFASNIPITMDLRDAELRDVFRMLGEQLKKNIIIDQSLPPALVTMTVKNTPLSDVFSYLMRTYDISYEVMGKDTIVIGTKVELSKRSGKEEMRSYRIAYADPSAINSLLPNITGIQGLSGVVDARLRTLYVTSTPDNLEKVAIALQKLDHPGQQVMLQARILEFTDGAERDVQAAINAVYDHWWFSYAGGSAQGGMIDDNRQGRNYTGPSVGILPTNTDMLTPMQGIWREFDMAFRAMEVKNKGKTLASPSIITIDGMPANIQLTEDYPYISGRDDAGNAHWSVTTVGPQLQLTPRVGRDRVITLDVNVSTGTVLNMMQGSLGEQMPRTSNRRVATNVRVRDGEPFVIGGLFREDQTNNVTRIPVLGQIPLLGELFSVRTKSNNKSQVVILVVPYILGTPDVAIEEERVLLNR